MASQSAELSILRLLEELCSLDDVGQIEVDDVVACYDVRVDLTHKISPSSQHRSLILKAVHFTADNWRALLQCEHISHEYLSLSLDFDDIGNLNHRIGLRSREFACLS